MRKILVLLLALISAPAFAQVGQLAPGTVMGNAGSSQGLASQSDVSSVLTQWGVPLPGTVGGTNNAFIQFSGPASTLKTFTLPNANGTIATLADTQTFTNKTFSGGSVIGATVTGLAAPSLSSDAATKAYIDAIATFIQFTGPTSTTKVFTLPNANGTIATLADTQTFTNKTFSGGSILNASVTGLPAPTASSDAATKSYVDGIATGLIIMPPSRLATAAILPNSPTYSNGTAGVGATLTAGANSTLTVDGTVAALNDVVLVKNQASTFQNGVYTVTTAGSGAAAWVLTRATYFDSSTETKAGAYTLITAGSANLNSSFVLAASAVTIGTDAIVFNTFSNGSTGVTNIAGVTGAITLSPALQMVSSALGFANIAANTSLSNWTGSSALPIANAYPSCADSSGNHLNYVSGTGIICGTSTVATPAIAANTSLSNWTGSSAAPAANAYPSCTDSGGNHLNYINGTGITCGTSSSTIVTCPVTTYTTNTTLSAAKCQTALVDATSGATTITLFAASSGTNGNIVNIKKIDSSLNNVTVAAPSGNIDGFPSVSTSTPYGVIRLQPDNSQWWQL